MESAIFNGIVGYVVFLFSVVCHEAGHALAALLGGDKTAYHNGQVSLSPVPHIRQEPFGLGLLPVLSLLQNMQSGNIWTFGYASAPYDPVWGLRHPKRAAWMALAGPATNFLIALVAGVVMKLGIAAGQFSALGRGWELVRGTGDISEPVAIILSALFYINFAMGVFNMIPIPPLDGFSILLFFIPASKVYEFFELRVRFGIILPLILFFASSWVWGFVYPIYVYCALMIIR